MNQPSATEKSLRISIAYALVLALAVLAIVLQSCKPSASSVTLLSPLPLPNAPTLTEVTIRQTLAAKATMSVQIDQTDTASLLTPKPKGYLMPTLTGLPTERPVPTAFAPIAGHYATPAGAGTIREIPSPGYGAPYRFTNQWVEIINNARTLVEVTAGVKNGSDGLATAQGVVIVEVWQRSVTSNSVVDNRTSVGYYPTPIEAGFIRIVDAVGERLALQSDNGTTFYFDVPSRQFVASLTAIVPTLPLSPLPTPVSPSATP